MAHGPDSLDFVVNIHCLDVPQLSCEDTLSQYQQSANAGVSLAIPGDWVSLLCLYPSYLGQLGVSVALGVTMLLQVNYLVKVAILLVIHLLYCLIPPVILKDTYYMYDMLRYSNQ